jgi:hypothetical protein
MPTHAATPLISASLYWRHCPEGVVRLLRHAAAALVRKAMRKQANAKVAPRCISHAPVLLRALAADGDEPAAPAARLHVVLCALQALRVARERLELRFRERVGARAAGAAAVAGKQLPRVLQQLLRGHIQRALAAALQDAGRAKADGCVAFYLARAQQLAQLLVVVRVARRHGARARGGARRAEEKERARTVSITCWARAHSQHHPCCARKFVSRSAQTLPVMPTTARERARGGCRRDATQPV